MSGLVALCRHDGAVTDAGLFDRLLTALAHRGPDGSGAVRIGGARLGQQHTVTTPEARHADPPYSQNGIVGVADVRLDNRAELLATLPLDGDGGQPVTDGALLCAAYDRWGVDCPKRLLGAFAFVLWDDDRQRLYCARDHMGIKPLYIATTDDRFVAASEPAPVLDCPDVGRTPDERRIGEYLSGRYPASSRTFHTALDRVPPGHWMVVSDAGIRTERYWSPETVDPTTYASVKDYERVFRELFADAVQSRLRTAGPVGSLLSGGLDSSSITSLAGRQLTAAGRPALRTFSAVFDTVTTCDESAYIDAVLSNGRFEPAFVAGDEVDPLADLDDHLSHRSGPYYPSLFMLIWRLYRAAGEREPSVVLQGYGGDQTMGSDTRGYLRGLVRRGEFSTLSREVRAHARRYPGRSAPEILWADVLRPLAPAAVRNAYHTVRGFDHVGNGIASIDRSFADRSGLTDRLAGAGRRSEPRSQLALRRRALSPGEPTFNLELNDIAGAYFGIEPRYPYFDKRLVEFSLSLPPGETVADGLDRTLVRRGLADVLPDAVRTRDDKAEFGPNVVHCTQTYAMDTITKLLFDGAIAADSYLDVDGLAQSRERLSSGDVTAARDLLMASVLESWARGHTTRSTDSV